jgi:hypothetical protein
MENKEFYTKEESLLVSIGKLAQALELDLMLLKMEQEQGLMDGLPLEKGAD